MKNFLCLSILITNLLQAQIGSIKVEEPVIKRIPYDSTKNYLGENPYGYEGQELYVFGKPQTLREYGYDNFYTSDGYRYGFRNAKNSFSTPYESVAYKYFKVLSVQKDLKGQKILYDLYFLKLIELKSLDTVFYKYEARPDDSTFPFVVKGFFEKSKNANVGKCFYLSTLVQTELRPVSGEKKDSINVLTKWKCVDLVFEEKYYTLCFVMEDLSGEKYLLANSTLCTCNSYDGCYLDILFNYYVKRFGEQKVKRILSGDVWIGMTEEQCKMSLGFAEQITATSTSTQLWSYGTIHIYFVNGKVNKIVY